MHESHLSVWVFFLPEAGSRRVLEVGSGEPLELGIANDDPLAIAHILL
jgi:hypothetical protein